MKKIDEFFKPQIESGLIKKTKANKIYPLLKSMTEKGLIEFYEGIHKKKNVKIYRLTPEGKDVLNLTIKEFNFNIKRDVWIELFEDLKICEKK
jgi:DNA-binding PadR family transcriptional regulator